ncbi:hypothetical protein ACIXMQ_02205 [Bacteroides fragilis]
MNIKRNTSSFKEKNRVSFFDNIFYWIWTTVPSKGFPDRSFVVVTVCQFSYVLLFVSILLTLFDDQVQLCIYDKPEPIAIPMLILLIILSLSIKIYDEKKYQKLEHDFRLMSVPQRKNIKYFFLFLLTTILVILVDIMLLYSYNSHMNNLT